MNKYEIIDMIDEGAYGIVWKATNRQTGALVAIKQFKEGDDDQISRRNIQRQIRMLKMLKGQYIVNIKQAFKKKNKVFLIFQYFPKNLLNMIEIYERGLDSNLINKIVYKLIKCLRFLHQKNIIHRDIKPQNILMQNNAQILKLCDFGFARFIPETNQDLTEYVATRWYRSPELLVGDRYGKPADIWALGCIIGELVDGQPMFPGENQMDQLYLIRKALGQLPERQIKILQSNQKYQGLAFPPLKKFQSVQARYIGKIQKKALSFMKACLNLDPTTRITVQQALTHPYLIHLSMQQNQHTNQQTNLLYSSRRVTQRNSQIFQGIQNSTIAHGIKNNLPPNHSVNLNMNMNNVRNSDDKTFDKYYDNVSVEKQVLKPTKTKFFQKNTLKYAGGNSLPQNALYKVVQGNQNNSIPHKISKKYSEVNFKQDPERITAKLKQNLNASPKLKVKKQPLNKLSKVMSEQKKINYNIDVKLNINLKINQKLKQAAMMTPLQSKLPQIKNNSKILKYRLNNKYPGANVNTIYNSYGNLSILGQTKEIGKGSKKAA